MENKDLTSLVGKTLHAIEWFPVHTPEHYDTPYDDGNYLVLTFDDGFKLRLSGNYYEDYTGNSMGEYPTYLSTMIQEPEGYNGPGMYEVRIKESQIRGAEGVYSFFFVDKYTSIPTSTYRFMCGSLEEAKSWFNLDQVEYVKWVPSYDIKRGDSPELEKSI